METLGFSNLGLLLLGHYFGLFYVIGHLGQVFLFGFTICKWIFNIFVLFFGFCMCMGSGQNFVLQHLLTL
ncbi:hypothetical protein F383_22592 [Gossypium arboreum]|uniref:Uncharacterized protein n=1 Tax=Gossypium arboreum TaxID=29729 RepID=A0A0B0MNK3_GOSAR|nr:hypothetical protein F383_22592 [Gossypium arboreum]